MNGKEVIGTVEGRSGIGHDEATALLAALVRVMTEAAVAQQDVTLDGVGTFTARRHPEYVEQAADGTSVLYPPHIGYRFQPDPTLAQ